MKSKGLIALLAVSCVAGSLSAVADTYYLTYQAKSASSGYLASGANYVKAGGKSRSFLLVKMTGTYAGDFSGLGDAVYLATDPKSKVAVEETTNVQLRQYFDTKDRALLFGMAYNIDNPQADPHAGAAPPRRQSRRRRSPAKTRSPTAPANTSTGPRPSSWTSA